MPLLRHWCRAWPPQTVHLKGFLVPRVLGLGGHVLLTAPRPLAGGAGPCPLLRGGPDELVEPHRSGTRHSWSLRVSGRSQLGNLHLRVMADVRRRQPARRGTHNQWCHPYRRPNTTSAANTNIRNQESIAAATRKKEMTTESRSMLLSTSTNLSTARV